MIVYARKHRNETCTRQCRTLLLAQLGSTPEISASRGVSDDVVSHDFGKSDSGGVTERTIEPLLATKSQNVITGPVIFHMTDNNTDGKFFRWICKISDLKFSSIHLPRKVPRPRAVATVCPVCRIDFNAASGFTLHVSLDVGPYWSQSRAAAENFASSICLY